MTDTIDRALAAAGEQVRAATSARDELIVDAVASGMSQRAVARAAGLSHTAIQVIVRRATP